MIIGRTSSCSSYISEFQLRTWLIGGRLFAGVSASLGSSSNPAALRIWIAGSQPVVIDGGPVLGATIYAPAATVSAAQGFELYGALLAASVTFGNELALHFGQAILGAGKTCGEPAVSSPP